MLRAGARGGLGLLRARARARARARSEGGGGAGGAGRRASELLWEGRARRSGHAWGGAARLEPPLQRRVGARKAEKDRSILGFPREAGLLP